MRWRPITEPPRSPGFYFCWHRTWGRVVMGYADGWGSHQPELWLDDDMLRHETPSPDCQKILRDGGGIGARATA